MKKTLVLVSVVLISSTIFAQKKELQQAYSLEIVKEKTKIVELSAGYVYGRFTDDAMTEVYENYSGIEASASVAVTRWLGIGLFVKSIKSDSDNTYILGDTDDGLKMLTWGPELYLIPSETFRFYARMGMLNLSGNWADYTEDDESLEGTTFDFGTKIYIPISKGFKLFAKVEYSIVTKLRKDFSDRDPETETLNGEMDSWSVGAGIAIRF